MLDRIKYALFATLCLMGILAVIAGLCAVGFYLLNLFMPSFAAAILMIFVCLFAVIYFDQG